MNVGGLNGYKWITKWNLYLWFSQLMRKYVILREGRKDVSCLRSFFEIYEALQWGPVTRTKSFTNMTDVRAGRCCCLLRSGNTREEPNYIRFMFMLKLELQ